MSDLIIKKNGTDYKVPMLAEHYPADRVYIDGDINKTVQDEVNDSGWQNFTTAYIAKYRKKGSIVEVVVQILNETEIPSQTAVPVGTLPTGFRPAFPIYGVGTVGSTGSEIGYMYVNTNGEVQIVNTSASIQRYLVVNMMFLV